jgi:CDP-diglyceride synthetase
MREFLGTGYLLLPLLVGGIFHGVCMKYEWLSFSKRPIDCGYTVRGKQLFGANKTFRGPLAVGLGAAVCLGVQATLLHRWSGIRKIELFDYGGVNGWLLGFLVGAAAMSAELPNSFVKRQLGVGPGQTGKGMLGATLYVVDQVDLLLGAWLVFALVLDARLAWVLVSLVLVVVVHQLLTSATYALGMRASPR